MKLLYVILTSEKFSERRELQKNTWLNFIGQEDEYVYLQDVDNLADTYRNVPYKYSQFIKKYKQFEKFDWVFFCDDDTFVFPKRLNHLLTHFDKNKEYMIGRTGVYKGWVSCSGGSGFAVSNKAIIGVKEYVSKNEIIHLPNSDTSLSMWAKLASPEIQIIDRGERFHTQHLRHEENSLIDIDSIITAHYCTSYDYKILSKHLKYAI